MSIAWAFVALAGCAGDGAPDDELTRSDVRVHVNDRRAAAGDAPGVPVLFHEPGSGEPIRTATDATGWATANILARSTVTVVEPGRFTSFVGTIREDQLYVGGEPFAATTGTARVQLPTAPAGTVRVKVTGPCFAGEGLGEIQVDVRCPGGGIAYLTALDASDRILGGADGNLQPVPGGVATLSASYEASFAYPHRIAGIPLGSTVELVRGEFEEFGDRREIWRHLVFVGTASGEVTGSPQVRPFGSPDGRGYLDVHVRRPDGARQSIIQLDGSLLVGAGQPLPFDVHQLPWLTNVEVSDSLVSWTGDSTPADALVVELVSGSIRWRLFAAPGVSELTIPPLPADLAGGWSWADVVATVYLVELADLPSPFGGWDEENIEGYPELKPMVDLGFDRRYVPGEWGGFADLIRISSASSR